MEIRYKDKAQLKAKTRKRAKIVEALFNGEKEEAIRLAMQGDEKEGNDDMLELVNGEYREAIQTLDPRAYARKICRQWGPDGISAYKEVINMLDREFPGIEAIVNQSEER